MAAVSAGNSVQFVFKGVQQGKPFKEVINFAFADDSKSFSLRAETDGGFVLARRFASRCPFSCWRRSHVPLRRALDEVAREVRARTAVRESIAREPLRIVQSRVRMERHEVEVVVVLLGKIEKAESARARMDAQIRQVSGVLPRDRPPPTRN